MRLSEAVAAALRIEIVVSGARGATGAQGPQGDQGIPGDAAVITADRTVTVGSGGTYATLQAALDAESHAIYAEGAKLILSMMAGFAPAAGVTFEHGDFSHVWVQSVDATVTVAAGFAGAFISVGPNCAGPVLNALIDMNAAASGTYGIHLDRGSTMYVVSAKGVINATRKGAWVRRSAILSAQGANFSGAGNNGVRVTHGGIADIRSANVSGLLGTSDADGHVAAAIAADTGVIDASLADASGCAGEVIFADFGSKVNAAGIDGSNCTATQAVRAFDNSVVILGDGTGGATLNLFDGFTGTQLIRALRGAVVTGDSVKCSSTNGRLLLAEEGCDITLKSSTFETSNTGDAVTLSYSRANLRGSTIKTDGIVVRATGAGAFCDLAGATITKPAAGTGPAAGAIRAIDGAHISICDASITECQGTIFQITAGIVTASNTLAKRAGTSAGQVITSLEGSLIRAAGMTVNDGAGGATALTAAYVNLSTLNRFYKDGLVISGDAMGGSTINAQTGTSYTLAITDAENVVECNNAAAIALSIPTNATVPFPIGAVVEIHQKGAGVVTVGGAGVTLQSRGSLVATAGQYAVIFARKVATDTWRLGGDLA